MLKEKELGKEYEFNPIKLTGTASKYITIPSSIILDTSMDIMRVAIFSFFMFRKGLDNKLFFSINAIIYWFNKKPDRHKGQINDKLLQLLMSFENKGYLIYPDTTFNNIKNVAAPMWEQFIEAEFNIKKVIEEKNATQNRFATIYLDELETILSYQNYNSKNAYSNNFVVLLVFSYLRMMIYKRQNTIGTAFNSNNKKDRMPEAYDCFKFEIAETLGISTTAVKKAISVLVELNLIVESEKFKSQYLDQEENIRWRTDCRIFCNTYKREKEFHLASGYSYYHPEMIKKEKILENSGIIKKYITQNNNLKKERIMT